MSWRALANNVLSTLFEPPCAACKQRLHHPLDGAVCDPCWSSLRLAPRIDEHYSSEHTVSWACAVDHYEGRMKEIIHALKYERRRSIAPRLGALMRECGAALLRDAAIVVPVPLHPRREYERGFNQAEDLALHLGLPVMKLLTRVRHTQSQIELPKEQRQQNVKNAFAALSLSKGRLPVPGIVVLIDDVSTTGSTLDACARVLKDAGVKEVRALTAARVVNARR
jgi:ComF family protein